MTEREFDRLLKQALTEAGKAEGRSAGEPMSPRQRERMERMLRDPAGYYRLHQQGGEAPSAPEARPIRRGRKRALRYGAAVVAAALLGGSALAYSLTGGAFFRQLFLRESADDAVSAHMDTEQLLEMGGGNVGAVQETEEMRLELLDAVSSGNSALIAIRVTVKSLDSFPQDGGTCRNYGFLDMRDSFSDSDDAFSCGIRYLFQEDDPTLGKNECILLLSYTSRAVIPDGACSIQLRDFGCWDTEKVLIPGSWTLSVELEGQNGHSCMLTPETEYRFGDHTYVLSSVAVTPLSLTLEFSCESAAPDCDEVLWAQADHLTILLEDGAVLDGSQFYQSRTAAGTGEHWSMTLGVEFGVPLPADSIQALLLGGQTIPLKAD